MDDVCKNRASAFEMSVHALILSCCSCCGVIGAMMSSADGDWIDWMYMSICCRFMTPARVMRWSTDMLDRMIDLQFSGWSVGYDSSLAISSAFCHIGFGMLPMKFILLYHFIEFWISKIENKEPHWLGFFRKKGGANTLSIFRIIKSFYITFKYRCGNLISLFFSGDLEESSSGEKSFSIKTLVYGRSQLDLKVVLLFFLYHFIVKPATQRYMSVSELVHL